MLVLAIAAGAPSPLAYALAEEHAAPAVEHGAAHDHIGHANASNDLEQPNEIRSDLAFFTLVVFLLLLAILWKFAWGPIIESLERREKTVADHIAEAERNHEEAKRLLLQYEQKLAAAAGEVRELMEEARRDAEHAKQDILAEAKAGAEAERNRACAISTRRPTRRWSSWPNAGATGGRAGRQDRPADAIGQRSRAADRRSRQEVSGPGRRQLIM